MVTILRQRNFALLWTGQIASTTGSWLTAIALPFYVYEHTHSPLAIGGMFMAQTLPPVLFGSFAGVWVDRWDHRRTMIAADIARSALSLLYVLVPLTGWIGLAYLAAFLTCTLSQFFYPARKAILPSLVSKENLSIANNLNSMGSDLASLVGPALGGVIALKSGLSGAAVFDAFSFLLSAGLISQMKAIRQPTTPQTIPAKESHFSAAILWQEWFGGLSVLKEDARLVRLFATLCIAMLGQGIINVGWIVYVNRVLGGTSLEYGVVQVAVALGGIAGASINTRLSRAVDLSLLAGISGIIVGIVLLATFLIPVLPMILALQVICGMAAVGFFVSQDTLLMLVTPRGTLGRISGAYQTASATALLLGQGIGSLLAGLFETILLLSIGALLYFFSGLFASVRARTPARPGRGWR